MSLVQPEASGVAILNAFVHIVDPTDRRSTGSGPLAGMEVAIKDNICTRGIPTRCGSKILANWVPPYDATVVERLVDAGATIIGKTNLDEFGMGSSTEWSAFGPTLNPHDPSRVPGGSSGGSAAAVASGQVPAAIGTDTGGSVRQPAAMCGVVGIKPTYGLVSRYGLVAYASSLDQAGVLAGDVATATLVLQNIAGHDPRDSTSIARPASVLTDHLDGDPAGLRVGMLTDMLGSAVEPAVAEAIAQVAEALADAGCVVTDASVPAASPSLSAYYLIAPAEASSNLARFDGVRYGLRVNALQTEAMMVGTRSAGFGPEVKRRIMLGTFALSAGYKDQYYSKAQQVRTVLIRQLNEAFKVVDVLLCPTSPRTAWRLGEFEGDPLSEYLMDICTVTANMAGIPAISIPWGVDSAGLPIGIQLMARALGEETLVLAAAAVERLAPPLPRPLVHVDAFSG